MGKSGRWWPLYSDPGLIWFVTLKLLAFELSNSLFFTGTKPTPRQRRFQWIIVYNVWQQGTGNLWRKTAWTPKGIFWVVVIWWHSDKLKLEWWRVVVFMWLNCLELNISNCLSRECMKPPGYMVVW